MGLSPNHKFKLHQARRTVRIATYQTSLDLLRKNRSFVQQIIVDMHKYANPMSTSNILEKDRLTKLQEANLKMDAENLVEQRVLTDRIIKIDADNLVEQGVLADRIQAEMLRQEVSSAAISEALSQDETRLRACICQLGTSEDDAHDIANLVMSVYMTQMSATEVQMVEYTKESRFAGLDKVPNLRVRAVNLGLLVEDAAGGAWAFNDDEFGGLLFSCPVVLNGHDSNEVFNV